MDWINIKTSTLRAAEYIGSDPVQRATWFQLLAYCVDQENGGRIVGAARWKDRQWQQACGVTLGEVQDGGDLVVIDGDDVIIWRYPSDKEAEVKANRENGRKGGRPRKPRNNHLVNRSNNHPVNPDLTHPEPPKKPSGITERNRKGNRNGKEGEREDACAREDDCATPLAPAPGPPGPSPFDADDQPTVGESSDPGVQWRMSVQAEPWARDIRRGGGKIGPGNWELWRAMLDRYGEATIAEAIGKCTPKERWPDVVESWIQRNRQDAVAKASGRKVTIL